MKVGVIGSGSFGTALGKILSDAGNDVILWSHSKDTVKVIKETRENSIYLPGLKIPDNVDITCEIEKAVKDKDLIVSVVPTQVTAKVIQQWKPYVGKQTYILAASKGVEQGTHRLVSDIFKDSFSDHPINHLFFLSGPSFAKEMMQEIPTAITIAGYDKKHIKEVQETFNNKYFRVYGSDDVVGVEIGGSLKNVIAVATGISDGLKFGNNTRTAIITRGLAEISRLGKKMGANPLTFMGLSGMGDLILTCTGDLSRNRQVGLRLGKGEKIKDIIESMRMVAEGVPTTESAYELAKINKVDMPITNAMYNIMYNDTDPRKTLEELMNRALKFE